MASCNLRLTVEAEPNQYVAAESFRQRDALAGSAGRFGGGADLARWQTVEHLFNQPDALLDLAHPLLGPRLRECTQLVLDVPNRDISDVFGYPDDLKFRSSMTLFAEADPDNRVFREALRKYFGDTGPTQVRSS